MDRRHGGFLARGIPCLLASWLFAAALAPAAAQEAEHGWVASAGFFDFDLDRDRPGPADDILEVGLEYRFARPRVFGAFRLAPSFGVAVNEDGGYWLYGTVRYDWRIGERWLLTPSLGAAYYEAGDGKELGQALEFRSAIEISRTLRHGGRIGAAFYHLSNADLGDINPGSNSLVLVYAFGS